MKEYRRDKRKERKRKAKGQVAEEDNDDEESVDPELAAMMGFSGFGTKRTKS